MSLVPLSLIGSLVVANVPTHRVGWHWLREIAALVQNTVHRFQRFYLDLAFDSLGDYFNVESVGHRDDHSHNSVLIVLAYQLLHQKQSLSHPKFHKDRTLVSWDDRLDRHESRLPKIDQATGEAHRTSD